MTHVSLKISATSNKKTMIAFANAKINLGLYVTEKRTDGFHNIESIFLPISIADALEFIPSQNAGIDFQIVGIDVEGNPSENLCVKAYNLLHNDFELPGIKCCLLKNIPIGAGLGGGSSDGVQMIKMLNEHFELNLSKETLLFYAEKLGSDCPFFIRNEPAHVTGRGEIMKPINIDMRDAHVVLIYPEIHISTATAFGHITPKTVDFDLTKINELKREDWQKTIRNDFEEPMMKLHPVLGDIKNKLIEKGAFYASMSGSGSAVYGLFESDKNLERMFPDFYCRSAKVIC